MHGEFAVRWMYPMLALRDDIYFKSIISGLGGLISSLFVTEPQWVVLVTLLVILDFISGVVTAKLRNERIESWGFRQTGIKAFEYIVLLAGCTMVANSFEAVDWLASVAYMYVSLTELKSIVENVTDPEGRGRRIWELIKRQLKDQNQIPMDENQDGEDGTD